MGDIGQRHIPRTPGQRLALLCCALGIGSAPVLAATDGAVGATSRGTIAIQLVVEPTLRLTGASDLSLPILGPTSHAKPLTQAELCVYSASGQYQLHIQGSGPDAGFAASNLDQHVALAVTYDDGQGQRTVKPRAPLRHLTSATDATCSGSGARGRLIVNPTPELIPNHHNGPYTGALTLLIAPE